nr:hypothetical protein [Tanacetum cinerariifolium]
MRTQNADSPKSPLVKKTPLSAGGDDMVDSLIATLGFSEAVEPSVGKMGTGSCPLCAMDNLIDTDPGIGNGSSMRSLGP